MDKRLKAALDDRQRLYEQNVQLRKDLEAAMGGREAMEATRDGVRQRDLARIATLEAEIDSLRAALASMTEERDDLYRQLTLLSNKAGDYHGERDDLRVALAEALDIADAFTYRFFGASQGLDVGVSSARERIAELRAKHLGR